MANRTISSLAEEIKLATTMQVVAGENTIMVFYPDGSVIQYTIFDDIALGEYPEEEDEDVMFSVKIGIENNRLFSVINNKVLEKKDFINFTSNLYIAYSEIFEILTKEQMLRVLF